VGALSPPASRFIGSFHADRCRLSSFNTLPYVQNDCLKTMCAHYVRSASCIFYFMFSPNSRAAQALPPCRRQLSQMGRLLGQVPGKPRARDLTPAYGRARVLSLSRWPLSCMLHTDSEPNCRRQQAVALGFLKLETDVLYKLFPTISLAKCPQNYFLGPAFFPLDGNICERFFEIGPSYTKNKNPPKKYTTPGGSARKKAR